MKIGVWEVEATEVGGNFDMLGKQFNITLINTVENRKFNKSISFIKPFTNDSFNEALTILTKQLDTVLIEEKERS